MWSLKLFRLLLAVTTLIFSNAGSLERSSRCYIQPTVEGCSIIRRKWSFVNATGSCELNFVCSQHSNAFLTKEECNRVCQPVAGPKQPPRDDCAYWIQNLDQCRFKRETFYPDRFGLRQRVLLFRFCGPSSWKLFAYYFRSGECAEIVLRS
uniref:Putative bovine pancreatic trypsin inhibitor n=1 Tax=Rhipicephalus microplus TaxID=6941 RepID=A0A6G5A5K7_RHIMP